MFRRIQCLQIALVLCVGVSSMAGAACGRWTTKTLPGPEWKSSNDFMFMAYEENLQKPVLYAYQKDDQGHWGVHLWAYSGTAWDLLWTGAPIMDPGWHFGPTWGMVFDQNRKALTIFCTISYTLPQDSCYTIYQFLPGQGWERIYGCIPIGATMAESIRNVVYDTNRKRTIIIGGGEYIGSNQPSPPITIEFDGWAIETKMNPPDYKLYYGSAGFNPETGKTVFYGYGREFEEGEVLETFEYDGATWMLVETDQRPNNRYHPISGLTFSPTLHGLLSVPSLWQPMQTWFYKNGEWFQVDCGSDLPARLYGVLQWDSTRDLAIYWGGEVEDSTGIHDSLDTLEFKSILHCRPVDKPSGPPQ